MGFYIQTDDNKDKAQWLIGKWGAQPCGRNIKPSDLPSGQTLVCVIDNGGFEAAGICFDDDEYEAFAETSTDRRPRTWLVIDTWFAAEECPSYAGWLAKQPNVTELMGVEL